MSLCAVPPRQLAHTILDRRPCAGHAARRKTSSVISGSVSFAEKAMRRERRAEKRREERSPTPDGHRQDDAYVTPGRTTAAWTTCAANAPPASTMGNGSFGRAARHAQDERRIIGSYNTNTANMKWDNRTHMAALTFIVSVRRTPAQQYCYSAKVELN